MPTGVYQHLTAPAEKRFWPKVRKSHRTDGCWLWAAAINNKGYGQFWFEGRLVLAHRFAYELLISSIPVGLILDHKCRIHNCVRPTHLEPVTNKQNILRGNGAPARNARKTHCLHGHLLEGDNVIVRSDNGGRKCRICQRAAERRYKDRMKGAA